MAVLMSAQTRTYRLLAKAVIQCPLHWDLITDLFTSVDKLMLSCMYVCLCAGGAEQAACVGTICHSTGLPAPRYLFSRSTLCVSGCCLFKRYFFLLSCHAGGNFVCKLVWDCCTSCTATSTRCRSSSHCRADQPTLKGLFTYGNV